MTNAKRVELAYCRVCSGVQIDMMDIVKVFQVGEDALAQGATEVELEKTLVEFVATIRKR